MTETTRTVTYIGVAVVLLVVAGLVNRKPVVETVEAGVGTALFRTELKSADDVAGLEIVTADDTGGTSEFRVVRGQSGWTLPLHHDYPADAEKEVASAAASLIDLKVLSVVATSPSAHAEYGVVDPEKALPGAEGVGKLVKVLDKSGNDLVRMIVGKQDAQAGDATDSQELRFVRVLPQDAVCRVAMPTAKFSTNFADWIETDLLKLDPWDIAEVTLKDYTFDIAPDVTGQFAQKYDQLSTIELSFNDKDSKWALNKLIKFEDDKPVPVELAADEELNSVRLNEMKTALDDLKIVDVRPKPAGMSANLRANKSIFKDQQTVQSLVDAGFYPVPGEDGQPEILSTDGEVLVQMKDGIEYTLRFGGVAGIGKKEDDAAADAKEKTNGKAKETDSQGTTLNRFIMVSARFNPDLIPKPELEAMPSAGGTKKTDDTGQADDGETKAPEVKTQSKESAGKPEDKNEDDAKSSDNSPQKKDDAAKQKTDDDKSAAAEAPEALQFVKLQDDSPVTKKSTSSGAAKSGKDTESKSSDKAKTAPETKQNEKTNAASTTDEKAKKDSAATSAEKKDGETTKGADAKESATKETIDAKKNDAKKNDETKVDADGAKSNEKKPSQGDAEKAALDRKRIEKENERKKKEYDEKIQKGEEKAAELNARFAGWYYVVSEATYRKIHLNRDDVIKKADAKKTDGAAIPDDADTGVNGLKIPPLKLDPFQERGDEKKDEEAKDDAKKDDETNDQ